MDFLNPPFGNVHCSIAQKFSPLHTFKGILVGYDENHYYMTTNKAFNDPLLKYSPKPMILKIFLPVRVSMLDDLNIEKIEHFKDDFILLTLHNHIEIKEIQEKSAYIISQLEELSRLQDKAKEAKVEAK